MNIYMRISLLTIALGLFLAGVGFVGKIADYHYADFEDEQVVKIEENKEAMISDEKMLSPVDSHVGIVRYFYDKDDPQEKQAQSLVLYEGVYRANQGVDYACKNEVFDVYAAISGTVTKVEEDPVLGKVISITQGNIVVTYNSLSEVSVKENDSVKQGDKIAKSGENMYEADLKNHMHFSIEKDGIFLNPEKCVDKQLSQLK